MDPRPAPHEPPFDLAIGPGQEVQTVRTFDVPAGVIPDSVVLTHDGQTFPGCLIIGNDDSLWHVRVRVAIRQASGPAALPRRPTSQ